MLPPKSELVYVQRTITAEQQAGTIADDEEDHVTEEADQNRIEVEVKREIELSVGRFSENTPAGEKQARGDANVTTGPRRAPSEESEEEKSEHSAGKYRSNRDPALHDRGSA